MMGIGPTGIVMIVLIALLLFGSKKLPELGRAVGRTLHEFKAGTKPLLEELDVTEQEPRVIEAEKRK
ncbi:twin-arginine translocase TatA/TatE family subunit [Paenibacillus sp. PAMC21692]|uniref:twin-arginine translocase TatA/TatE family subunit n=1 Tax=Paenibacillus sp. PAMC21692 TaxID=2762320 RepID=UPI00164CEB17|nr:twin-arginine translocase TatA/TatE family subunit [Paenibacillus sp. PAMC21692]QNK57248.1 twin-arginine translocase TatA/TatE family subunit [Paenibacillus sp. PAMC21692]